MIGDTSNEFKLFINREILAKWSQYISELKVYKSGLKRLKVSKNIPYSISKVQKGSLDDPKRQSATD
jgi:hypothetical protein